MFGQWERSSLPGEISRGGAAKGAPQGFPGTGLDEGVEGRRRFGTAVLPAGLPFPLLPWQNKAGGISHPANGLSPGSLNVCVRMPDSKMKTRNKPAG